MITAERYHDFSCGHRVHKHESKCAWLHGHNYRVHFVCAGKLDVVGRVLDFSVIKAKLCMWVENAWDHKFLAWDQDPIMKMVTDLVEEAEAADAIAGFEPASTMMQRSIVWVPFNPTAENMAEYLLKMVGPAMLAGTGVELIEVRIEETRKCSATARL